MENVMMRVMMRIVEEALAALKEAHPRVVIEKRLQRAVILTYDGGIVSGLVLNSKGRVVVLDHHMTLASGALQNLKDEFGIDAEDTLIEMAIEGVGFKSMGVDLCDEDSISKIRQALVDVLIKRNVGKTPEPIKTKWDKQDE